MKRRGHIKAGKGNLVGNAGEYYVMAEPLKRGWVAALAPRNAPGFDILVTDGGQTAKIRVKTKSQGYADWQWVTRKDGALFRDLAETADFTVLVNLAERTAELQYFVVPTQHLYALTCAEHDKWLATPGRNGRPHNSTNRNRHVNEVRDREFLAPFEDAWDGLWQ